MSTDDVTTDEPDVATWDPHAWLSGATSTVRSVVVYGRADLLDTVDDLHRRAQEARRRGPDDDRALGDEPTADAIEDELIAVHAQWSASALTIKVEGRSEKSRKAIDKRLKAAGVKNDDDGDQTLAYLADAIIEPAGLDEDWLRAFREKSESQYAVVVDAYAKACRMPPVVTVPSSGAGSGNRAQRRSS